MGNGLIWARQVHIFYEAAGTAAAFLSSYLLLRLGSNYGMVVAPVCFVLASLLWWCIGSLGFQRDPELKKLTFFQALINGMSPLAARSAFLTHRTKQDSSTLAAPWDWAQE